MKRLLLALTLTTLIFACKKEDVKPTTTPTNTTNEVAGCMDILAVNYNSEATEDDGSCEYLPTQLILSGITINAIPLTNNGANWDVGLFGSENPDVFYVLKSGSDEIFSSSSQDNIDACPISFTEGLPYTITNFSEEYTIELYDNDQIAGIGGNELMGSCSFTPNEYIANGGDEINITSNGIDMTLDIEWLQ
tara:strand:- start:139 stop:714 length:576 start_codon:yes stop_codon:yes gene_type:complete